MNNLKDIELIDQYLNGTLPDNEAIDFAQRLQNEPELQELLDDFQGSDELFKLSELSSVKAELDKYDYTHIDNKGWSKTTLTVAGLAVISAGIIGSLFYQKQAINNVVVVDSKTQPILQKDNTLNTPAQTPVRETANKEKTATSFSKKADSPAELPIVLSEVSETPSVVEPKQETVLPVIASTEKPVTKAAEKTVPAVNCNEQIRVKFSTESSCSNTAEGSIHVNEINGGSSPYIMTVNGYDIKGNNGNFGHLSPGTYNITVTDAQGCVKTLHKVEIKAKDCSPKEEKVIKTSKNHLISLSEQSWKIPSCPEKGFLEIKNQQGNIIFNTEVTADANDSWNLMESDGGLISTGIYFYRLVDQVSKMETIGTITVIQ